MQPVLARKPLVVCKPQEGTPDLLGIQVGIRLVEDIQEPLFPE